MIPDGDTPDRIRAPALPDVVVRIEPSIEAPEPGMVTGTVAPSARPQGGLATLEAPPVSTATQGVDDRPVLLEIPDVEVPPADPALVPVLRRQVEPAQEP